MRQINLIAARPVQIHRQNKGAVARRRHLPSCPGLKPGATDIPSLTGLNATTAFAWKKNDWTAGSHIATQSK
jgi:hypothetical protein